MNASEAISSIVKLLGLQFKKETFKSVFLVDGTEVTNNQESEFEVGQTLYVVKESTLVPAPEGNHETREGLIVSVDSESIVIAIAAKSPESSDVKDAEKVDVEDDSIIETEMTIAEDAQGQKLESKTFDVGEEVFLIKEDGTKEAAPNGEHQVVLKDESGNENKIRIQVMDGKITERENVEEMKKPEMMNTEFTKQLDDIKNSMMELMMLFTEMNGKFKTDISSLKSEFETFKKSPERTSVEEKVTFKESFADYKLDLIKSMRNLK
jgi:hypothetical protein